MAKERRTLMRNRTQSKSDAPAPPRTLSATELYEIRKITEQQIDEFMKKIGDSDPLARTDEEGWRWFEYRSVRGRAGIIQSDTDGEMFFRVESMVMEFAPKEELDVRLLRELLRTNMTVPGAARVGITDDGVFAIATLPVSELRADDVSTHIRAVMALAANLVNPPREQVMPAAESQRETTAEKIPDLSR